MYLVYETISFWYFFFRKFHPIFASIVCAWIWRKIFLFSSFFPFSKALSYTLPYLYVSFIAEKKNEIDNLFERWTIWFDGFFFSRSPKIDVFKLSSSVSHSVSQLHSHTHTIHLDLFNRHLIKICYATRQLRIKAFRNPTD